MSDDKYTSLITAIESGDSLTAQAWAKKMALDVQLADERRASLLFVCPHCLKNLWVRIDKA